MMKTSRESSATTRASLLAMSCLALVCAAGLSVSSPSHAADPPAPKVGKVQIGGKLDGCLGLVPDTNGLPPVPTASSNVGAVDCDYAPTWSVWQAGDQRTQTRIGYGGTGLQTQFCLDVDTANPFHGTEVGLWYCQGSASVNQLWIWPSQNGSLVLASKGTVVGEGPSPDSGFRTGGPGPLTFTLEDGALNDSSWIYRGPSARDIWVAPETGLYRIFGTGGGGGGADDVGGGGGSGYTAFAEVTLTKGDQHRFTVGDGGRAGQTGQNGGDTTFGTVLVAAGGQGGQGPDLEGGKGGSGGASASDGNGKLADGGALGRAGINAGFGAGAGQGPTFWENAAQIMTVQMTAGSGGTGTDEVGQGGGGGGGVNIRGDSGIGGQPNSTNTAQGGEGYGGGGAGGNAKQRRQSGFGGDGAPGLLIIERVTSQ